MVPTSGFSSPSMFSHEYLSARSRIDHPGLCPNSTIVAVELRPIFSQSSTLPKGSCENLIALPLQKMPRNQGFTVFVVDDFKPLEDQWSYLNSVEIMTAAEVENAIRSQMPPTGVPRNVCRAVYVFRARILNVFARFGSHFS